MTGRPYDWQVEFTLHRARWLVRAAAIVAEVLGLALLLFGVLMLIGGLFVGWVVAVLGGAVTVTGHGLERVER